MFSTVAEPFYIPTKCLRVPIFLDPCLNINIDFVRLLSVLKEKEVSKGKAGSSHPSLSLSPQKVPMSVKGTLGLAEFTAPPLFLT